MITDWPRITTWIWKQTVNINLRQQTDDNDTRQWTYDKLGLDLQLPDNDKKRLDQNHLTKDLGHETKTKDNSKRHKRNAEQFFDKRHDNRHKDKIHFEEEWNQQLLQTRKQQNKLHLKLDQSHDNKKDQRHTTNKKPVHLRLKSKLNKVIALFVFLSLLPGATSRCITLPDNVINEKGRTAKVKFSTVDCSIQKISIPLSNQETNAGLLPLKFKVYEYGIKPGEEPTTKTLDKTTNKPGKENEFPPDKVSTSKPETEVIDKPGGQLINKPEEAESQGEEAAIAPQTTKTTTDGSLDDDDGKLLPQFDPNEEGTPLNKPDTDDIIKPEAEPEELVTPKLDPNEEGTEPKEGTDPIEKPDTEDIDKPGVEPINKPEEAATPKLDPIEEEIESLDKPVIEDINKLGSEPIYKPEEAATPELDHTKEGIDAIDKPVIEDIDKPKAEPTNKPEEAVTHKLDHIEDPNKESDVAEANLDTEDIEAEGNKPSSETDLSLAIGAQNDLIETIVEDAIPKVTKQTTNDLSKDESFLESDVSLVVGADEEVFDNIQGNILPVTQRTVNNEVANEDNIKSPVTKSNMQNVDAIDFIPDESKVDPPKHFDGEEISNTGKQTTKQRKATKATTVTSQMNGDKTTTSKNGNDETRTDKQTIENNIKLSAIISKSTAKIDFTNILKNPTDEEQIKENTLLEGDIGIASTESAQIKTKTQTIEPLVEGRTTASTGEEVTDEKSTKDQSEEKISMMTQQGKQITESGSLNEERHTTSNKPVNKDTTKIQIKDTLETMNENLHQFTKIKTSKEDTDPLSDKTKINGKATTISMNEEETTTNKLFSEKHELPTVNENLTHSITSSKQNINPLKGNSSGTSMEPNIHSTSRRHLSKEIISTSSKTAAYEDSEGLQIKNSSVTQTGDFNVSFSNNGKETTPIKNIQTVKTDDNLAINGDNPTKEIKATTTTKINKNYSESNFITINDRMTNSKQVELDTTVMPTSHKQQRSTPTKEKGENEHGDRSTTSDSKKIITEIKMSKGNTKSSENQSKVIVTTMEIKDNKQTMLHKTTTSSEISINEKTSLYPENETKINDNIVSTIFDYSERYDKSATNKYEQEVLVKETKSSETSSVDKNNNNLTSKITNEVPEHVRTSKTTKAFENIKMTKTKTKLTTPLTKNQITQKEQSGSNRETIEDPSKGSTEMRRTSNTENNDFVTKIFETKDSRPTPSAKNIMTSNPFFKYSSTFHLEITPNENEFESSDINDLLSEKTSLKQGSTKEKELSLTTEFTEENLSKLTQPLTIEGPKADNPEHTEGNIDTGAETTSIVKAPEIDNDIKLTKFELHYTKDIHTGKTLVQNDNTDKLTETTKDSGTSHDDKQVETTDSTEDKMKTTKETDSKEAGTTQPTDILELMVSPEESEGTITQLTSNSYSTTALSNVLQTKNIDYSTTEQQQATDVHADYDRNTQISTSITFGPKTKTWTAGEITTKELLSEQKEDTMGLMNTNKMGEDSVTPKQASSTKITKLISENGQTGSKHSTTEDLLDIGNDVKTFGIDHDSTSTSTLTTPCVCPTPSTISSSTESTTSGILTTSGSCLCPGIASSMAEEETSTNMPEIKGRRRRRKEIEEMELYVDNFDQKIMKKMPFLKFY